MTDNELMTTSVTGGMKGVKPCQIGELDPLALYRLGEVAGFGREKYGQYNFLKGFEWSLAYNAAQRHLLAFWGGEDLDPESGMPHVLHAAWQCLALASFELRELGVDDRFAQLDTAPDSPSQEIQPDVPFFVTNERWPHVDDRVVPTPSSQETQPAAPLLAGEGWAHVGDKATLNALPPGVVVTLPDMTDRFMHLSSTSDSIVDSWTPWGQRIGGREDMGDADRLKYLVSAIFHGNGVLVGLTGINADLL